MATARPSGKAASAAASARSQQRRTAAAEQAAALRAEQRRQWSRRGGVALVVLAAAASGAFLAIRGDGPEPGDNSATAAPVVGGDLHTVTSVGDSLFVGGHAAVAVSRDGGRHWKEVPSLSGADAMGWAVTPGAVLVGGHPGLLRSADDGRSFVRVPIAAEVSDVHALGGASNTLYLASPQAGLMSSIDGGRSWDVRNAQVGRTFMGTILVDPREPTRLIAPDMSAGLTISIDGGRTWKPLGGPGGAMAAAWKPSDINDIIAVGMNGGARSTNGGVTWQQLELPMGTRAVSYDASGRSVYAGVLDGQRARTYVSTDSGTTWRSVT